MHNVYKVQFGLLSNAEKDRIANIDISNAGIKSNSNSLYDPRLGPSDSGTVCFECKYKELECSGHWAKITFPTVFPHPYYIDEIKMILQCTCLKCSNLLYKEKKMIINGLDELSGLEKLKAVYKYILSTCEKSVCDSCSTPIYKILVSDNKFKVEFFNNTTMRMEKIVLKYTQIYEIFKNMSSENFLLLGFNEHLLKKYNHPIRALTTNRHEMRPEDFFMSNMLVVPPCIRPSSFTEKNNHDDLTIMSSAIIKRIKAVNTAKTDVQKQKKIDELQTDVYSYFSQNAEPSMGGKRQMMNIPQRLKGKDGQFRAYIESTRCDYGGRSVIGPDTSLKIYEIGIPQAMAKMTQSIRIADYNRIHWNTVLRTDRKKMQEYEQEMEIFTDNCKKGLKIFSSIQHVKYECKIQYITRNQKKFNSTSKFIKELHVGDIIDVCLQDGMEVLLNRNPTIREESINAYIVRIHKNPHKKTITFNPASCTSLGADFDGDEGNIFVPQGEFARAEMKTQIFVSNKIISPQCGYNIITLIQDVIIGMYTITCDDVFIDKELFFTLCMQVGFFNVRRFYKRLSSFNHKSWNMTGRMACSILFPEDFYYDNKGIVIEKGIVLKGTFDKGTLGSSKNSIIHKICIEYGCEYAAEFISNVNYFANTWNSHHGYTFGIMDCMITKKPEIEKAIAEAEDKVKYIKTTNKSPKEKEIFIVETLMNVNAIGQKIAKEGMIGGLKNAMSIATLSGARGNFDNLMSISCCVGLQTVEGKRIEPMLCESTRILPTFLRGDNSLQANCFIKKNYLNGLEPTDMLYASWATRNGLIDTAVTTSSSGYGHRRFEKKMENCRTHIDATIRDCNGKIVDFCYGEYNFNGASVYFVDGIPFCCDPSSIARMCNVADTQEYFTLSDKHIEKIISKLLWRGVATSSSRATKDRTCFFLKKLLSQCRLQKDPTVVKTFIEKIIGYFNRAIIAPGEMIGGKASNAMGEDSTQGALSSFHDSGRSTKSVVTGLPRLMEIINLTTELSITSSSFCTKNVVGDEIDDKIKYVCDLRKFFEYRTLQDIASICVENNGASTNKFERLLDIHRQHVVPEWVDLYCKMMDLQVSTDDFCIVVSCNPVELYKYRVTLHDVVAKIQNPHWVCVPGPPSSHIILIYPDYDVLPKKYDTSGKSWKYYYTRDYLMPLVKNSHIFGIPGIKDIYYADTITSEKHGGSESKPSGSNKKCESFIKIDVQGHNFSGLYKSKHVIFPTLETDVIADIYNELGIAAAYNFLYSELVKVFSKPILPAHIMLLARTMTRDGILTNVSRHGINDDVGIITKMMNETVMEIVTNGASQGVNDGVNSCAAAYVLGNLGNFGTSYNGFDVLSCK